MYGLPEEFTGAFFIGCALETVQFWEHMVELGFDKKGVSICLQSQYELIIGDESYREANQLETTIKSSRLMHLIGLRVKSVNSNRDGTLTLHFENECTFRCFDSLVGYESYTISDGSREIWV